MAISLFEHNLKAYEAAFSLMQKAGKAAVIHPTGTGKSFIAFKLAEQHPDRRVCWFSPSEYIFITQMENLKAASGGHAPDNVVFCTYAKLMMMGESDISDLVPDYIVLDEFHRCGATEWGKGVAMLLRLFPDVPILGLSATNIRYLDGQRDMADELFDGNIASQMTLGEAIVRDILLPPKYVISVYAYQQELEKYQKRISSIKSHRKRDITQKYLDALRHALDKADGLDVVFQKHMTDRSGKYIVFCANVEHLNEVVGHVREWFKGVDPDPHVYTAYADDPEASKGFADFKRDASEHLKLLFCIDMLNEGVHVDDISGVLLFRPTISPTIYKQQIGRALSASKCKQPVILDIVNNFDNLCSIDTIEEEMRTAAIYYRRMDEKDRIINEHFEVLDEVLNCRSLFDTLEKSLVATWETSFGAAKAYFNAYGHLDIPKAYKTEDGLSLGTWIRTQRSVRAGTTKGNLSEGQIARLDSIHMIWDNPAELYWERNFLYAQAYWEANGDLDVSSSYITEDGFALGQWISTLRRKKCNPSPGMLLTEERIARLEAIGMLWSKLDYQWEQNYLSASKYFLENGHLNVPIYYVAEDGFRLGAWISELRRAYKGASKRRPLTDIQIERLTDIGMVWGNQNEREWYEKYAEAKEYFACHGHLNVPASYITPRGTRLGNWLCNHRNARVCPDKYSLRVTDERIARLDAIGMIWREGVDAWDERFVIARAYYKEHGNLNVPRAYIAKDGFWLGKWVSEQRKVYVGAIDGKSLTREQANKLESIGMSWLSPTEVAWEEQYACVKTYFDEHGDTKISTKSKSTSLRRLGRWLHAQQAHYQNEKLTAPQIAKLKAIGVALEPERHPQSAWERCLAAAEAFYRKNGHLDMPVRYVDEQGVRLGIWLANTKREARKGTLSEARIRQLNQFGVAWETKHEEQWNKNYMEACVYFQCNGHLHVPKKYITSTGFRLGNWICAQRKARWPSDPEKVPLSQKRIRKLDAIEMDWGSKPSQPPKRSASRAAALYEDRRNFPAALR